MAWTYPGMDGPTAELLRSYVGMPGEHKVLAGIDAVGDGKGGVFVWTAGNFTDEDDNTLVPRATLGRGAWLRAVFGGGGGGGGGVLNPANVLDFGADPTGVADSAPAINAAASEGAPNGLRRAIYLPTGTYRINSQINLTSAQCMFGDSRGSTILSVDQAFSSGATAVIFVTASGFDAGPVIRDLQIAFAQPQTPFTRAGMLTLAGGGTSGSGGTGIMYPWAIASGSDSFRIQVVRVRVFGAWDGITTNGHNTIYWLDDVEMGALDCGVSLGEGASGVLDFAHINGYHFWNWGFNFSTSPFSDGQTIGMRLGNQNGLVANGISMLAGRMVFTAQAASGWFDITNLALDGDQATLEVANAQWIHVSNFYATCGVSGNKAQVAIAAGYALFTNWYSTSSSPHPMVSVTGSGYATILGGTMNWGAGTAITALTVSGGMLKMNDIRLVTNASAPNTVPLIAQSSGGQLQVDNLDISGAVGSGGIAVQIGADNAANIIGTLALGSGWSISVPNGIVSTVPFGNLGSYGAVFPAPLDPTSIQTGSASFGSFSVSAHFSAAYGQLALGKVQNTAINNTAFGSLAGYGVTTGQYNTFVGEATGGGGGPITANNNSCFGALSGNALTSGAGNTLIGTFVDQAVLTTGANNILIGNSLGIASASTSNTINIGNVVTATGINSPGSSVLEIAGSLGVGGGAMFGNVAGPGVNLGLQSATGNQRAVPFYTGSALRWSVIIDGSTETGGNTGSNFGIYRYNDAGTLISASLKVDRSTGAVTMADLATSTTYANDAAAAVGGVIIGQLYRNGSVVQIRVS